MSYSWSNDPTKSAIHGIASRQAGERGKQPINVFRCSVHVTANGRISTSANETNDLAGESRAVRGGTFSATSTHIPEHSHGRYCAKRRGRFRRDETRRVDHRGRR